MPPSTENEVRKIFLISFVLVSNDSSESGEKTYNFFVVAQSLVVILNDIVKS